MPLDFTSGNEVFTHPGQEQMQVEVILASKPAQDTGAKPIYTIRLRYPRIIHGEVMTHRVFSRNARSSRAVPVETMLKETTAIPFVPWHWGKNQKGMQADEECIAPISLRHWIGKSGLTREDAWLHARDAAVEVAEGMMNAGYHKQIPNRLLEPFSWIDVLITACDWDNFLWLRDHEDAEDHLQDLARLVKKAIEAAEVQELEPGEWHLPYITEEDIEYAAYAFFIHDKAEAGYDWLRKISAARCARISYKPFNGDSSYKAELDRYNSLVTADRVHASPLEHQATPDEEMYVFKEFYNNDSEDTPYDQNGEQEWKHPEQHGNLPGYIQARKLVPNERYVDHV